MIVCWYFPPDRPIDSQNMTPDSMLWFQELIVISQDSFDVQGFNEKEICLARLEISGNDFSS